MRQKLRAPCNGVGWFWPIIFSDLKNLKNHIKTGHALLGFNTFLPTPEHIVGHRAERLRASGLQMRSPCVASRA